MRLSIAVAMGIVGFVSLSTAADARDGCGRGFYFNGYACVPSAPPPPPPGSYYGGGGGYGWGGPPPVYYQPQPRAYYGNVVRPSVGANGQISCGNPRYTWQNGACRPYSGR